MILNEIQTSHKRSSSQFTNNCSINFSITSRSTRGLLRISIICIRLLNLAEFKNSLAPLVDIAQSWRSRAEKKKRQLCDSANV